MILHIHYNSTYIVPQSHDNCLRFDPAIYEQAFGHRPLEWGALNMSESENVRILFCQIRKMSESENVRIGKSQNLNLSESENVRILQNWKTSESENVRIL